MEQTPAFDQPTYILAAFGKSAILVPATYPFVIITANGIPLGGVAGG